MSMKSRFFVLLGSFIFAWVGIQIYELCQFEYSCQALPFNYRWFMNSSIIVVVVAVLNFFTGAMKPDDDSLLKELFRKTTQEDIDALYNPAVEPEAETRARFNLEERSRTWCADSNSYIDYDGYRRNVDTDEREYMNSADTGNGKRK